jgi:hypothetical protein
VFISSIVTNLGLVFDISGSFAVIPFMFIFPGWLQVAMDGQNIEIFSLKGRYNGYAMIGIGVFLSVAGMAVTFAGL